MSRPSLAGGFPTGVWVPGRGVISNVSWVSSMRCLIIGVDDFWYASRMLSTYFLTVSMSLVS